jgi:SAM-dependent methyltransferase
MNPDSNSVQKHYQAVAGDYSEQYKPTYQGYPANLKRLEFLVARLRELNAETLLDCGCGEGTPLARLSELGLDVWGFDAVPEMAEAAKAKLDAKGPLNRVWQGDISQRSSFKPAGINMPPVFDVSMAMGVFPHIGDEAEALSNMAAVTRPNGRVLVEFRNELFSLFTLNRYSFEFFRDKLINIDQIRTEHPEYGAQLDDVQEELKKFFRLDLPPVRQGTAGAPGYDEILSKFHNPFDLAPVFDKAGLHIVKFHFYHFHALPPLLEKGHADLFRTLSLEMEQSSDWRGYFMASAFVVEASKKDQA